MKHFVSVMCSLVAASAIAAVPTVTVGTLSQNPNSKRVTIPYTLSEGDACIVTFDIQTNGANGYVSIGGEHLSSAWGDVNHKIASGGGEKTIYWNPATSGNFQCELSSIKAVVSVWPLSSPPDYMVVDLSNYRQHRFYPNAGSVPWGVTNAMYKTDYMIFRKCPAKGVTWRMGAGPEDTGLGSRNDDQHLVTLTNDFYIGIYEVTQRQDRRFIDGTARGVDRDFPDSAMRPVSGVTYTNIRNKNSWPNDKGQGQYSYLGDRFFYGKTGLAATLPTETQWEFAARAGTRLPYGSSTYATAVQYPDEVAWNANNAGGHVQVVGTRKPNDWGIYDMFGNVREWCLDYYRLDYGLGLDDTDWLGYVGPTSCEPGIIANNNARVLRGGAYNQSGGEVQAAGRNWGGAGADAAGLGYRIVLPVEYPL